MYYILFILAAIITVITAIKLSTYADVLSEKTSLGGMLVGTLLLAGATSLPEVTTSITAVLVGNPDIAVSNVFGSNLFNILILALVDTIFRKKMMLKDADSSNIFTGYLSLLLTALMLIAVLFPSGLTLFAIGIEMYLLVIFYSGGLYYLSKKSTQPVLEAVATEERTHLTSISLKEAKIGFAIAAAVIFFAGSFLSIAGDQIAASSGISSSFVGTFLIAGATSLPELVTVFVAVRLASYNLAIGNILGSNLFNLLILLLIDGTFRADAVLASVHPVTLVSISAVIVLNILMIVSMIRAKQMRTSPLYVLPSIIVIITYFIASYVIFAFS
ncbi:sodium:calcium antiporter [Paenalkalicoccus suaedae]|uniref:Sodium:calcium antiporter n=1 Tax=Paenalkalicoccus suaedae TaxID=2592382 RepID=A0A859FF16_9BACI|nr:sodium:calcium antiporter [Paenalkalicoccus suaedae]QKS71769.1 sodium:calcium antiporter [Paenalkalicoccus suaedae]